MTSLRTLHLRWILMTAVLGALGCIILSIIAVSYLGSFGSAVAFLRGDRLLADSPSKSFGTVRQGEDPSLCSSSGTLHLADRLRSW